VFEFKSLIRKPSFWPIAIHCAIALFLICTLNIWTDEAYSLTTTGQGLAHAWHQSIHFENQPPLYFILLTLWRQLSPSIIWARIFSLICTTTTLAIAPALCKRYAPTVNPLIVTSLLALNPFVLWCATDIRAYAWMILLSTFLHLFFYDAFLSKKSNQKSFALYVLTAILALYSHYFIVCLLIAHAILIGLTFQFKVIRKYAIAGIFYSLGFIPALSFFFIHLQDQGTGLTSGSTPILEALRAGVGLLMYHLVPLYGEWDKGSVLKYAQYGFVALLVAGYSLSKYHNRDRKNLLVFKVGFIIFLVFLFLVYKTGTTPLSHRYVYPLVAITQICMTLLITEIAKYLRLKNIFVFVCIGIILCFSVYSNFVMNRTLAREGDWIRVAQYIQKNEQKNQPIILYSGSQIHSFLTYYKGKNSVSPVPPKSAELDKFDMTRVTIYDIVELKNLMEKTTQNSSQAWFIKAPGYILNRNSQGQCIFGAININCEIVDQFINQNFQVEKQIDFYQSQILLLRKKPA
jgi:hypothetical protein